MKRLTLITSLLLPVALHAAALNFGITWTPNQNEMAGLSTNAYLTNIAFVLVSTTDVTQPTNTWPQAALIQATSLTNQGPVGSVWTFQASSDSPSRFFAIITTNTTSGTVSPFSNLKPFFTSPNLGTIVSVRGP